MVWALRSIDREKIPGDIVECGVWAGGNIILARKISPLRFCWLYDTFAGMPEPSEIDVTKSGKRALDSYNKKVLIGVKWSEVSVGQVRQNLETCGVLDEDRLRFVEGKVEDTLLVPENLPDKIALLRLDTDWYASTKIELEILYPLLAPGGVLIVDDYGHWQGARKAVDDYLPGVEWTKIDYTAVMMVKRC